MSFDVSENIDLGKLDARIVELLNLERFEKNPNGIGFAGLKTYRDEDDNMKMVLLFKPKKTKVVIENGRRKRTDDHTIEMNLTPPQQQIIEEELNNFTERDNSRTLQNDLSFNSPI